MEFFFAMVVIRIATDIWPDFGMVCVSGCL